MLNTRARQSCSEMKRIVFFLLLGPLIGMLATLVAISVVGGLNLTDLLSSAHRPSTQMFLLGALFTAYPIGALPAIVACATDIVFSAHRTSARVLATTLAGCGSYLTMMLMLRPNWTIEQLLALGLTAAIPAAVCSWLSGEKKNAQAT